MQISLFLAIPANRLVLICHQDGDISFVKVGMPVNVSVDSSGEFDTSRKLVKLGSDVLPPDRQFQQYRFRLLSGAAVS